MAEELLDRDKVNAAEDQVRGERVPQIVKSTGSDAGATNGRSKRTCDALDRITLPFEHSARPWTLNPLKRVHGVLIHGDMADSPALRLLNRDDALAEADVFPRPTKYFSSAHARVQGNHDDGAEVGRGGVQ